MTVDVVARLRAAGCVFADDEADLIFATATTPAEVDAMVQQRVSGRPLEHVLGWAEFCGLRIAVEAGVFVPRRRTEALVARAVALAPKPAVVLDICCGSGALGVALATALGAVELHAADAEPAAVRCARRNVGPVGGTVYEGDLFDPLPLSLRGRVDVLLANVPYVPSNDLDLMPLEARVYEPRVALDGGGDGLDVLRRVGAAAPSWLAPGGHLLSEVSERQAGAALEVLARAGLIARAESSEDSTVVIGARPR
jgi:release factor glutamine methyltransferase